MKKIWERIRRGIATAGIISAMGVGIFVYGVLAFSSELSWWVRIGTVIFFVLAFGVGYYEERREQEVQEKLMEVATQLKAQASGEVAEETIENIHRKLEEENEIEL